MNYTKAGSAGVLTVVGGSVLYSSLSIGAVVLATGALTVLFLSWQRRKHDRAAAR